MLISPIAEAAWFGLPKFLHFKPTLRTDSILNFAVIFLVLGLETMGNMSGITKAFSSVTPPLKNRLAASLQMASLPSWGTVQRLPRLSLRPKHRHCVADLGHQPLLLWPCRLYHDWHILYAYNWGAVFFHAPKCSRGAAIAGFAILFLNDFKMIARDGLTDRNVLMLCVTFGLGYALGLVPDVTAQMPSFVRFIFGNPLTAVCVASVTTNLIFPGRKEEEVRRCYKNKG